MNQPSSQETVGSIDEDPLPAEPEPSPTSHTYSVLQRQFECLPDGEYVSLGDPLVLTQRDEALRRPRDLLTELYYGEAQLLAELLDEDPEFIEDLDTKVFVSLVITQRSCEMSITTLRNRQRTLTYEPDTQRVRVVDNIVTDETEDDYEFALAFRERVLTSEQGAELSDEFIEYFLALHYKSEDDKRRIESMRATRIAEAARAPQMEERMPARRRRSLGRFALHRLWQ